jgi:hypothetical protein
VTAAKFLWRDVIEQTFQIIRRSDAIRYQPVINHAIPYILEEAHRRFEPTTRRLMLIRAVPGVLFWEVFDQRAVLEKEADAFLKPLIRYSRELIVTAELRRHKHVRIASVSILFHEYRLGPRFGCLPVLFHQPGDGILLEV